MAIDQSKEYTIEHIANKSFDKTTQTSVVQPLSFDGTENLQRDVSSNTQIVAVVSGEYSYFCFAAVGTALATPNWLVFRVDDSGNKIYADGNAEFDNVATDPTSLTFSYTPV